MLKLHLDTDLGGDIDDLCALALVLNWPEAQLLAVTTNLEDQGIRAGYVRYVLALAGRAATPVAAGADRSLGCFRIKPHVPLVPDESVYWPEPVAPAPTTLDEALVLLERSIEQGATIAAIGAFTNLALLERRKPGILRAARLYLMGGYVFPPRAGFPPFTNEMDWNVQVDAQSALYVLQHSSPTLVPLSITIETSLRRKYLTRLRQAGPLAQLIARQAEAWAKDEQKETRYGQKYTALPDDLINFQHDPLTCAIALGWHEGVEISEIPLTFEIRDSYLWQRVDDKNGKPTKVVTRVAGDRFSEFWLDVVTRQEPDTP
ncbi:MAG TPA: nucleoside hydrolase [Pyrinomonadaceae bacterium]|jgi:inosine-uridine nucleoside N-ribohydrolase